MTLYIGCCQKQFPVRVAEASWNIIAPCVHSENSELDLFVYQIQPMILPFNFK